jgi:hypothetical protein
MLVVDNKEHFQDVLSKIIDLDKESEYKFGLMDQFISMLGQLSKFGDVNLKGDSKNHLCYDSAPLSFIVNCVREKGGREESWYTIGLIFHNGAGMNDGTFSVELDAPPGPHWSLHS